MQTIEVPSPKQAPGYLVETERLLLRIPNPKDIPYEEEMCMDERFQFMLQYKQPERCTIILILVLEARFKH